MLVIVACKRALSVVLYSYYVYTHIIIRMNVNVGLTMGRATFTGLKCRMYVDNVIVGIVLLFET